MTNLTIIDPAGTRHILDADPSLSLMEAIRDSGIDGIVAECGGTAACATCHVMLAEDLGLEPASEHETGMLDFAAVAPKPGSRLSCQIRVAHLPEGAEITLPETQF
ncbi:(2Fe-2S)-binding protein [Pararhodobacter zhoushanensis]|uniref:(2Fe-2S)-binding protein n=1 Tax=Pararhodobacter zhoushanensis TaxID=2479545 RepID=A0ABT3GXK4_9RHOB|nr:(2Fe-2S)-binding protein [Pararhodobacter zhoushanensis]MCW1932289.1 (2Fe-2S)-binding protein [Pararhodobacter zhoushanensis]